jgi:hypothetical protein
LCLALLTCASKSNFLCLPHTKDLHIVHSASF